MRPVNSMTETIARTPARRRARRRACAVWVASIVLVFASAARAQPGGPFEIRSVVARDVSIGNRYVRPAAEGAVRSIMSRELSIWNSHVRPADVVPLSSVASRELSLSAPPADLFVERLDAAPRSALFGEPIAVSWRVRNGGNGTARGGWIDRLWLSATPEPPASAPFGTLLAEEPITAESVAPGESYERGAIITLPLEQRSFWLVVETGFRGGHAEESLLNNVFTDDLPVASLEPPSPDLVVAQVIAPVGAVFAGTTTEAAFVVTNASDKPTFAPDWKDSVFLTVGEELHDPLWGEPVFAGAFENLRALPPGESYLQIVPLAIPERLAEGTYRVAAYADSRRIGSWRLGDPYDQPESDERNNWAFSDPFEVTLSPLQPDLEPQAISFPLAAASATTFTVTWNDVNLGLAATGGGVWTDCVYLSENDAPSIDGDRLFRQVSRSGAPLGAGAAAPMSASAVLPADFSGSYFVKVHTDVADRIYEPFLEGNNLRVSSERVTVVLAPSVDLTPTSASASTRGYPGHEILVSWSVENIGAEPGELFLSWTDAVYVSVDGVLDTAADLRLGVLWHATGNDAGRATLPPYSQVDARFRLPATLAAGTYSLFVVVDDGGRVFEGFDNPGPEDDDLKERNNTRLVGLLEVERFSSDLTIEVDFDPEHAVPRSGAAGQALRLMWRVRNGGALATPVPSWLDRVYLSADDVLSAATDFLVGTVRRSDGLLAGESYLGDVTGTLPFVAPGPYWLVFATDADQRVLELAPGEENNTFAVPFVVTADAPDLGVIDVRAPKTANGGETIFVEWTVTNDGNLPVTRDLWVDDVYLSRDGVLQPAEDTLLGSRTRLGPLAAGARAAGDGSFELPIDAVGLYRIVVVTDARGVVFESNETNNVGSQAMLIDVQRLPAPNLVVTSVTLDGMLTSGQEVRVRWSVENRGDGPTTTAAWNDSVFISRDLTFDPGEDLFLGYAPHDGVVEPGAGYSASVTVDVPLGIAGPHFLFVVVDRGASNFEEGVVLDNQRAADGAFDVRLPEPADLVVERIDLPAEAFLGEAVEITRHLTNAGDHAVTGRWHDAVYLSIDSVLDAGDAFFGRFESRLAAPLVPGRGIAFTATAPVPAVRPGEYHALVVADIFDQVPEDTSSNNSGASAGTISVRARPLLLDGGPLGIDLSPDTERFFELEVSDAGTVRIRLDPDSETAWTELFVRYDRAPTPGRFDLRAEAIGQAAQVVTIPETRAGRYYVLARATRGTSPPEPSAAQIEAFTIPFSVEETRPSRIGDAGRVTVTVRGSRFLEGASVRLVDAGGASREARVVRFVDATELSAVLVADGLARGPADIVLTNLGGAEARLTDGIMIEQVVPPLLELLEPDPPALRDGPTAGTLEVAVVNRGNVDAQYVLLFGMLEDAEGREVVAVRSSSPFSGGSQHDGLLRQSTLLRGLAPGSLATLSVTARAGSGSEGAIAVDIGGAVVTTEDFLEVAARVAEAVRARVLEDDGVVEPAARATLVAFAADPEVWRDLWFERLVAAGVVDRIDVDEGPSGIGPRAQTRCVRRGSLEPASASFCGELDALLCDEWLARLVATGAEAVGGFAPEVSAAAARLRCDPRELVACTFCTTWEVKRSVDPNEKTGADGAGGEDFVPAKRPIGYRVHFENLASASGPASVVKITDPLDAALNPGSFRLGNVAFGDTLVEIPPGRNFHRQVLDLSATRGIHVELTAGIDARSGEAFWLFRSLDPLSGLEVSDADLGFLPPADGAGEGLGWVEYSVAPKPTVASKIVIKNDAEITFDANEPIGTNEVLHTVDADAPASSVAPLPDVLADERIELDWDGEDVEGGSGLRAFSLYASEDGGPFVPVLTESTARGVLYTGRPGHAYAFYTLAIDHAGNEEEPPETPDTTTRIAGTDAQFRRGDVDGDAVRGLTDAVSIFNYLFLGGRAPACFDAADVDDDGTIILTDGVFLLNYLFLGGPPPPAPGGACGADATPDGLAPCAGGC